MPPDKDRDDPTPGSGEVYASAHDLARFAMFHLKDARPDQQKILDQAQLDELHRPATEVAPGYWYAMGWQVLQRPGDPEVLYHGGGQAGVASHFVLVLSHSVACIILSNRRDPSFLDALRDRMLQTVIPGWHAPLNAPEPALHPLLVQLSLGLKLRGAQIDGEIVAWEKTDRNMTILPHWAVLRRQPDR